MLIPVHLQGLSIPPSPDAAGNEYGGNNQPCPTQHGQQCNRCARQASQIRPDSRHRTALVQPIQGSDIGFQLLQEGIVHRFVGAPGTRNLLDQLSGRIAQRCRAVEYGRDKRVVGMGKQHIGRVDLDPIVRVMSSPLRDR